MNCLCQRASFVPVLKGQTPNDWRKAFYYQYYEYPEPHHVRPHYGVITDRYKLVHFYGTGENYTELFDLQNDPHELKSLFGQPDYSATQQDLEQQLVRVRKELMVPGQDPPAAFGNKPVKPSVKAGEEKQGK